MNSFYSNPENLLKSLACYMAIFSEGHSPTVPMLRNNDGTLNVVKTLELAVYSDFPKSERDIWLSHNASKQAPGAESRGK